MLIHNTHSQYPAASNACMEIALRIEGSQTAATETRCFPPRARTRLSFTTYSEVPQDIF